MSFWEQTSISMSSNIIFPSMYDVASYSNSSILYKELQISINNYTAEKEAQKEPRVGLSLRLRGPGPSVGPGTWKAPSHRSMLYLWKIMHPRLRLVAYVVLPTTEKYLKAWSPSEHFHSKFKKSKKSFSPSLSIQIGNILISNKMTFKLLNMHTKKKNWWYLRKPTTCC